MRYIVPVLVCVIAVSCQRSSYYGMNQWAKAYEPPAAQAAASDEDIRESVFRYMMSHNESTQQQKAHAYYLSVEGGQDPSAELLARFTNSQTPVRNQSAATITSQTPLGVYDKQTQLPGIVFSIDGIRRNGDVEADVTAAFIEGGRSAMGHGYHLKFRHGKWIVLEASTLPITH